nr:hypothetical protein Iba_chr02aCG20880 [Ipomoea batatas]
MLTSVWEKMSIGLCILNTGKSTVYHFSAMFIWLTQRSAYASSPLLSMACLLRENAPGLAASELRVTSARIACRKHHMHSWLASRTMWRSALAACRRDVVACVVAALCLGMPHSCCVRCFDVFLCSLTPYSSFALPSCFWGTYRISKILDRATAVKVLESEALRSWKRSFYW